MALRRKLVALLLWQQQVHLSHLNPRHCVMISWLLRIG
jgi:hypothetical protein